MEFFVRHRTRLAQLWGLAFIALYVLSNKILAVRSPVSEEALSAVACALLGLATVGRLWCAQYIAGYKLDRLVTEGPYSICRHPLYLFSFLGAVGVGCCTKSIVLTLLVALSFAVVYPGVMASEERGLIAKFGDEYRQYMKEVPAFFPKFSHYSEPKEYVVVPRVFRREVFDAAWFIWVAGIFELVEITELTHVCPKLFGLY